MYKFKELHAQKNEGQALIFSDLSEEDLKDIVVHEGVKIAEIAELFNIDIQMVEKKAQFAIEVDKFLNKQYERFMSNKKFNAFAKKQLFKDQDINMISKALTHFAFRNGPVEGMHADGKLSEEDMKILNKFMVNRLAYVFELILNDRWGMFDYLVKSIDRWYGHDWDKAEPDSGSMDQLLKTELEVALTKED